MIKSNAPILLPSYLDFECVLAPHLLLIADAALRQKSVVTPVLANFFFLNFIVLNNILIAYYKCKPLSNEVVYKWLVWYKMSLNVILAVDRGVR